MKGLEAFSTSLYSCLCLWELGICSLYYLDYWYLKTLEFILAECPECVLVSQPWEEMTWLWEDLFSKHATLE